MLLSVTPADVDTGVSVTVFEGEREIGGVVDGEGRGEGETGEGDTVGLRDRVGDEDGTLHTPAQQYTSHAGHTTARNTSGEAQTPGDRG